MGSGPIDSLSNLAATAARKLERLVRQDRAPDFAAGHESSDPAPLFIHYGVHKTGSSSIQQTLQRNSGPVFGYYYPDMGVPNHSLAFSHAFRDAGGTSSPLLAPLADGGMKRRERSRRRIASLLGGAPKFLPKLTSAEVISHFNEAELASMDTFLAEVSADRIYLGYIREPVSYLRSLYQETLKNVNPSWHLMDPDAPKGVMQMRTQQVVDRLEKLVGRDRVWAFAFDREGFPQGDVVGDLLGRIGVQKSSIEIVRANDGLSLLGVKLLYLYRTRKVADEAVIGHGKSRKPFISGLSSLGSHPFNLHPDLITQIIAANQPVFDWSAKRLDRPLVPPVPRHSDGVRVPEDLAVLSPDEVTLLSDHLGTVGLTLPGRPDTEAIVDAIHALRLHYRGLFVREQGQKRAPKPKGANAVLPRAPKGKPQPAAEQGNAGAAVPARGASVVVKPRLYLHVSMGKPAATPIAEFAVQNRAALQRAGLTCPDLSGLSGTAMPAQGSGNGAEGIDPALWAAQLAATGGLPILLSSDLLTAGDPKAALRSAASLKQQFDVRAIVYVRRIDERLVAGFGQGVLAGTQRVPLQDALAGLFEKFRNDRFLGSLTEAFGGKNVMVRPYGRGPTAGSAILQDLCRVVGVAWSEDFVIPASGSPARLGRSALEFKRWLNMAIPDVAVSGKFNARLATPTAAEDTAAIIEEPDLLPGAVRRMLVAQQEGHFRDLVKAQPGLDGTALFSADLPADEMSWTPLDLTPEAFAAIGTAILTPDLRRLLRQEIVKSRSADDPQRLLYAARFQALL